jgi:sensor histidine kinase YesM
LTSAASSPSGELYALELVPARQISGALPAVIRLLQILSVAAVIVLPILLLAMQHWVLGPVAQLNRAIETVEGGDLDYRIPEKEQGTEFNRINRSFNHMMDQVEELKISVYEEQLKAQKIKLGFLAQQIKPHFILNTLNILYSYEQEEFPLIQRMIVYLSRYFRYVINANQDFVTLGQEMEHLRNYFEIQQARYVRTFEATVDYDPDLANCLIPPLLLQSFAENAIKYALLPDRIVQIRVTAEKTETGMRLTVTDDGRGISSEMLERIEQFRRDRVFRMDLGVGVQNAIDRVELLYSGQGSVMLAARDGGGTLVTIDLPALHRRETEHTTEAKA